jgi:uncharacterized protein (DUF1684 family)
MRLHHLPAAALLLTLPAITLAQTPKPSPLTQWRAAYAANLAQPDGWLALVALQWLQDGETSVGSAPGNKLVLPHTPAHLGIFRQHSGRIEFLAPPEGVSQSVLLDGKPAAGGFLNADDNAHPSLITTGDVRIAVIHRGDRFYLRVKDAYSPTRLHFRGLNWYAPNPRLRITAKWVPYTPAKTVKILNVLGQASEESSPGYAEFTLDGHTVRLDPLAEGDGLFFDFRDATSHSTTDGAGRFLNTGLPSNGLTHPGTLIIDFNYAHNPPCGYTPYATCPLPPDQNRLTVAIPAGEKRYGND